MPEPFRDIFRGVEDVVASTRGWEPGSLNLSQGFAMKFRTPLVHGDVTRLLIDFSQDGDARWSEYSRKLTDGTRLKVVDRHERPFRAELMKRVAEDLRRNDRVVHVMLHTDPSTNGLVMLETPANAEMAEKYARAWRSRIAAEGVDVRHVAGSGETPMSRYLTSRHPADRYAQIRLSVSQTFFLEGVPMRWEVVKKILIGSLMDSAAEVTGVLDLAGSATDPR